MTGDFAVAQDLFKNGDGTCSASFIVYAPIYDLFLDFQDNPSRYYTMSRSEADSARSSGSLEIWASGSAKFHTASNGRYVLDTWEMHYE